MLKPEQFEREKRYWAALCILKSMLKNAVITNDQYLTIVTKLRAEYAPIFGGLAS